MLTKTIIAVHALNLRFMRTSKKIGLVSIGGTSISFGNIVSASKKFGNKNLEYLDSFLKSKGYESKIIYCSVRTPVENDVGELSTYFFDVIVFFIDLLNARKCIEICKGLKQLNGDVKTICFGRLIDNSYKEILTTCNCFDYACLGDPERSIDELIQNNFSTQGSFKSVATQRDLENKEMASFFDADLQPSQGYYVNGVGTDNFYKTYVLETQKNVCFGQCSFCWSRKGKYEYRTFDSVFSEIQGAYDRGIRDFLITDNDLFDIWNEKREKELLRLFHSIQFANPKCTFSFFSKSKTILKIPDSTLIELNKCGLYCVFVGVDAGNNQDKALYKKGSSLREDFEAIEKLNHIGFFYRVGFIFTNPYSTLDTFRENYKTLTKIRSANIYHYGHLKLMLLPGTKIYFKALNDGLVRGKGVYDYVILDPEARSISILVDSVIENLEKKKFYPFITLKRKYEELKSISGLSERYCDRISQYEEEEFNSLKKFFGTVFLGCSPTFAKIDADGFVDWELERSRSFRAMAEKIENDIREVRNCGNKN